MDPVHLLVITRESFRTGVPDGLSDTILGIVSGKNRARWTSENSVYQRTNQADPYDQQP
jgi:hypothetical protein